MKVINSSREIADSDGDWTYPPEADEILQRSERDVYTVGKRVAQKQNEEFVV